MSDGQDLQLGKLIEPELKELLASRNYKELRESLNELDPVDIGEAMWVLNGEEKALLFRLLPHNTAVDVFEYMPYADQADLVHSLNQEQIKLLVNEMEPDDRTALLEYLPGKVARRLIELLRPEERQIALELLEYPEESIGRLATPEYVDLREDWTVAQALEHIRKIGKDAETINVVYVVDQHERLIDDLRLRQLIFADPDSTISDLMDRQFMALNALDDQEMAIEIMTRYDRLALPVIDRDGTLVGIVTHDDIFDVAEEEATEDIHMMGGVEALDEPYLDTTILMNVKKRVGWLSILLVGGFFTTNTMGLFESEISKIVILSVFVPLIVSNGGNAGSQAATLVIRAMALQEIEMSDWFRILLREMLSGLLLGLILGTLAFGFLQFWPIDASTIHISPYLFMLTVSLSVMSVVLNGTLVGSMLPFLLKRLGVDPALSSTPFVATLSDISGVVIYFTIARFILAQALV